MRQVTGNMTAVVKNMDRAMASMNLDQASATARALADLPDFNGHGQIRGPVRGSRRPNGLYGRRDERYGRNVHAARSGRQPHAAGASLSLTTLTKQVADEAGLEMQHELGQAESSKLPDLESKAKAGTVEEDQLAQRLRALRPAT